MATVRLYDDDPYLERFSGAVVGFRGGGVVLNRTAFYAEAGGQAGDTGWLGGVRVVDTKVGDGGDIVHIMEEPPGFKVGDAVDGLIDWGRRCRIMRLHTASHIMEYFLWEHFGYMERTGSYVDERKDRADYVHEGRQTRTSSWPRATPSWSRWTMRACVTGAVGRWRCCARAPT